jgi:Fic family protein
VSTLSNADRALGELAGLGRTLPNPQLLIAPFISREAVLSSRIEGTQTDLTDLYAYEAGQLPLFAGLNVVPMKLQFSVKKCNSFPENYT